MQGVDSRPRMRRKKRRRVETLWPRTDFSTLMFLM